MAKYIPTDSFFKNRAFSFFIGGNVNWYNSFEKHFDKVCQQPFKKYYLGPDKCYIENLSYKITLNTLKALYKNVFRAAPFFGGGHNCGIRKFLG